MSDSEFAYTKEGRWDHAYGYIIVDTMGKKKVAAYIDALTGMVMYMAKQLGGKVVVPSLVPEDLNMQMKISQLSDGQCEILVREKQLLN